MLYSQPGGPQREEYHVAGLDVGQKMTYFELPDQQDYPWSLSGQLEMGPVMLIFYSGDWSPYCNGQLASYARGIEEFEKRGAQLAGISVDPPANNASLVGKLLLPFPLLSDPEGELARLFGVWNEKEGVATPSIVVVDQSGEVRYLYSGKDIADRPRDEEVLAALDGLDSGIERLTGGPEFRVGATQAAESSVRPERRAMEFEQLIPYYRGVYFTTEILGERLGGLGRAGKQALGELNAFRQMVSSYIEALEETIRLR
jgi:peroxiredoxin